MAPGLRPTRPQSRLGQSGAGQSGTGQSSASQSRASQSRAGRVARREREVVAGRGRDRVPPAVNWPAGTGTSALFRLDLRGLDPARGDTVIGAFAPARLLRVRLLTLEARVVVHEDDRGGTGPGPSGSRPGPAGPPGSLPSPAGAPPSRRAAGSSQTVTRRASRPVPQGRADPPHRLGSMRGAGPERLARAVGLVEQGADTLERIRRAQYRG